MRVPDELKKCVVFLGLKSPDSETFRFGGTGFFVSVTVTDRRRFIYLVTAKHVAEKLDGKEWGVRINTKDGKSSIFAGFVGQNNFKWFYHPTDQSADVAVLRWRPEPGANADYLWLPPNVFLKQDQFAPEGIGIGDEVCIVGRFSFHEGNAKNHPILRIGNVAMLPDERIETGTKYGAMEAYLIEARSIGGLSGSPVFVASEGYNPKEEIECTWYLMGLIHGHWDLKPEKVNDFAEQDSKGGSSVNVGISIVTPAQKILDILHCDEFSKQREAILTEERRTTE